MDCYPEVLSIATSHNCEVIFCGVDENIKIKSMMKGVVKKQGGRGVTFSKELDVALGEAEDRIISKRCKVETKPFFDDGDGDGDRDGDCKGFMRALELIDRNHNVSNSKNLGKLSKFVRRIDLARGTSLFEAPGIQQFAMEDSDERGLFFVEYGELSLERNPNKSTRSGSNFLNQNQGTITGIRSRGDGYMARNARARNSATERSFRNARLGAGWILGATEFCCGLKNAGVHICVADARLHFIR